MEIWKKLKSPYDKYEISNYGNIKNTKNDYIFSKRINDSGYHRIVLSSKNKLKNFLVHRIVAEYFMINFNNTLCINHIDGNRMNNNISNLECLSIKENNNRKVFPIYGRKSRSVCQYDKDFNLIKTWNRIKDITNISKKGLFDAIKSKKLYKGYYWKYYREDIIDENWKIIEFKNINIEISSYGRIKLKNGKISYGGKNDAGYFNIVINKNNFKVHRLVCIAFKPFDNYENLVVNHIDGDRGNNRVDNLEWVTQSYNTKCSYNNHHEKRNIFRRPVIRIDENKNLVEYESLEMASKLNNIKNKGNIVLVCQNIRKKAGGFSWKYKY